MRRQVGGFRPLGDVCSTPFGITEGGMPAIRRATAVSTSSAQRLSASQRGACRRAAMSARSSRCSTPFGITEGGIRSPDRAVWPLDRSAQRLSASQRGACVAHDQLDGRSRWCSTPFGITEGGMTGRSRTETGRRDVLNAFRHHRGGHVLMTTESQSALTRAQRLSASQRGAWLLTRCAGRARYGAQRLSASQRGACRLADLLVAGHEWCSTPFGITEGGMAVSSW